MRKILALYGLINPRHREAATIQCYISQSELQVDLRKRSRPKVEQRFTEVEWHTHNDV